MRTAPPHYDYPAVNMADNLPQQFEDFVCGATRARAFEQELLTLCATTPDSVWDVLALLDQYYRRDKLSADFCRAMRHKIERHVLGTENFETIFASSEIAVVLPKATAGTVTAVTTEFSHRAAPTKALPSESDIFPAEDPNPREQASRSHDRSAILVDSVPRTRSASAKTPGELHVLLAQAATFSESQKRAESRRRLRTSQVTALTAVVLGVAAPPVDREQPKKVHTAYKSSAASAAPDQRNSGPELISLSSDQ
jgi:hypothetical protein